MATGRLPDPNTAPLTAKGDLYTYSTVPARLAVGSNGDTLVADSSATTGLRWQADWNTGKNKIINGDFRINQRGFTSNTTSGAFNFDRWFQGNSLGTFTVTPQTFTLGAAPVAGYEGTTFLRGVVASHSTANDTAYYNQKIESVRTLAGQTVTVSFWAKAGSGTPKIGTTFVQLFGSGGSPSSAVVMDGQSATISTSWARYSFVFNIPSISGKTLGTANDDSLQFEIWCSAGSNFNSRSGSVGLQNNTFDIWGVQVEAGSVATPFTTATGTLAGELAACQRYYYLHASGDSRSIGVGASGDSTNLYTAIQFPTTMRTAPTLTAASGTGFYVCYANGTNDNLDSWLIDRASTTSSWIYSAQNNTTIGFAGIVRTANASASIAFSSEL